MVECSCYHEEFGKSRCYGTKEMEECSCKGNAAKCNFYPTKRTEAIDKERVTDIFTLLQKIQKTGYKITFETVCIRLTDPGTSPIASRHIKILMRVDRDYFKDSNGVIFDTIDAMIEDMEESNKNEP